MSTLDRGGALRAERARMLVFCDSLSPADWRMDSRAPGWSITDVVAHLGSGCHAPFTRSGRKIIRGATGIEQANDALVEARRDRLPAEVLREYRRWSRAVAALTPVSGSAALGRLRMPLADLGRFPVRLLASALVFDHHTHLRYDMAPALHRPAPDTDANRMAVVLEWMMAVLANQLAAARPVWLDRPLSITLSGPGGGSWRIESSGAVTPGRTEAAAARITGVAAQFPEWGTKRADWRQREVGVAGDADYAARFLDETNII